MDGPREQMKEAALKLAPAGTSLVELLSLLGTPDEVDQPLELEGAVRKELPQGTKLSLRYVVGVDNEGWSDCLFFCFDGRQRLISTVAHSM